ncbi:glycoside hydrolase family 5 protein [Amycolatopsis panacis]|uniref:Glycoside hydrolase n=1 Tax=Amycolatopsis panacis TaxID=2340917 RepID=A0A419HXS1_9PSEU|nr:cellulase family glycosylhydrolase [Amycolatopsis panacis]RJQ81874.1 glycoside hydrolase [Amycolatopsis panacis]
MRILGALCAVLVTIGVVAPPPASAAAGRDPAGWVAPLSTRGRYIVDAEGNRFKLKAANWHGASGTWNGSGDPADPASHHGGEIAYQTPLGLDRASIGTVIDGLAALGLTSVRLQFSNAMIHDANPVPDLPANPQLRGLTPLQVYDRVVDRLTARGFAVILNNHTTTSRWCCGLDGNERWNTSQTEQQWQDDWLFMARRYAANKRVVGADLYNEVRRSVFEDPGWGQGNGTDWQRASRQIADRILTEANPDLLMIVEGINWTGLPVDGLPHGRPTLEPARTLSHTLVDSGKLVYSAHFYGYTGPNHSGATGIGETHDPRYRDLTPQQLRDVLYRQAFFVSAETDKHYSAPLWISEFGEGRGTTDKASRAWFENFLGYLAETDTDFAYWPAVGFRTAGEDDGWSLLAWDGAGGRTDILDGTDWRGPAWRRLIDAPSRTGQIPPAEHWSLLDLDYGDFPASRAMRAKPDWDPGARKATCPDGQRLTGLAHNGNRGLCTGTLATPGEYTTVTDESSVDTDWARGYTKRQCPPDHAVVGYSVEGAAVSAVLCGRSATPLGHHGRTAWFDRGDNRPGGEPGGDFASGHYKGQCTSDEYVAGVAATTRVGSNGEPDALLCRS